MPRPESSAEKGKALRLAVGAWAAYSIHAVASLGTAWFHVWVLPIPQSAALLVGAPLAILGGLTYAAGARAFGSLQWATGIGEKRLVSSGIYKLCRHPQYVGWSSVLLGAGIAGRSGLSLLLSALLIAAFFVVVPLEERLLIARLGSAYREYRERTPCVPLLGAVRRR